jgi:hypothetical protein
LIPALDQLEQPPRLRCPEITRTDRGFERCHRDEHGTDTRHHVRDRSWYSGQFPRLRPGQPCDDECSWPDLITPYLGGLPKASNAREGARIRTPKRSSKS